MGDRYDSHPKEQTEIKNLENSAEKKICCCKYGSDIRFKKLHNDKFC
jgi:hypothetical protein